VHVRVLGLEVTGAITLPGFSGALLLDPATFLQTPAVVLDAAGQAQVASSLPNLPGLVGFNIIEQSAQVSGSFLDIGTAVILEIRP
jgi:hypothetical protein